MINNKKTKLYNRVGPEHKSNCTWWALPVQIVRQAVLKEAALIITKTTRTDQEGDGHRDG